MKRSKADLEEELVAQLELLRHACKAYDEGVEIFGKHIALSVRVLVHHHGQSKALLEQLGLRSMLYCDTAGTLSPRNLLPQHNLVALRVTAEGARYVPILGDAPSRSRLIRFLDWWNNPVLKDQAGITFRRRELILQVADTDGGAHVDSELEAGYMALSRKNSLGWRFTYGGRAEPLKGRPELACVRQIGYELLESLQRVAPNF